MITAKNMTAAQIADEAKAVAEINASDIRNMSYREICVKASDMLDSLDDSTYEAFANHCDSKFAAGPTVLSEESPEDLIIVLNEWLKR